MTSPSWSVSAAFSGVVVQRLWVLLLIALSSSAKISSVCLTLSLSSSSSFSPSSPALPPPSPPPMSPPTSVFTSGGRHRHTILGPCRSNKPAARTQSCSLRGHVPPRLLWPLRAWVSPRPRPPAFFWCSDAVRVGFHVLLNNKQACEPNTQTLSVFLSYLSLSLSLSHTHTHTHTQSH
jgi:hypothetical protein